MDVAGTCSEKLCGKVYVLDEESESLYLQVEEIIKCLRVEFLLVLEL